MHWTSIFSSPWIFAICLGGALALMLFVFSVSITDRQPVLRGVDELAPDPAPAVWRLVWWIIEWLAPACRRVMPVAWQIRLTGQLREAGLELALTPAQFVAGRVVLMLLVTLPGIVFGYDDIGLFGVLLLASLAWLLPGLRLSESVHRRRRGLIRDLPVMLDLISLAVQAGATTPLALAMAVERGPAGPMRDELARVMREIKAGRPRQEALRSMADRLRVLGLLHAVAASVTADKQGADLCPVLRAQAGQRREERFLDAERRAMQAPVKLLLPLVAFIFPGTFLVLLFPVAMQLLSDGFFS